MTKLLILLLGCAYYSVASHHYHVIPVENYETELQDLGQHTETHETPVKVIKITKTIAVKIPVPYPVKVIEKVPYPVHVNKPYPVQVPHVIQLPKERTIKLQPHQEASGDAQHHGDYQVQEAPGHDAPSGAEHSFASLSEHIQVNGFNYDNNQHPAAFGNDYSQAPGNAYGASNEGHNHYASEDEHLYEHSKPYSAIKPYF